MQSSFRRIGGTWFPDVLEAERQHDLKVYPERYDHIWEGSYARAFDNVTGKRYRDHLEDAGFDVVVIPNQGAGAAMQRIEAVRRILPFCFFNEETTEAGIACLGYYHEKKDEQRHVGLGPEHDFSSHAADSFGLIAICYEGPDGPQTIDELFERQHQYADATRSEIAGY